MVGDSDDVEVPQGGVQRRPGGPSIGGLQQRGLFAAHIGHQGRAERYAVEVVLAGIDGGGLGEGGGVGDRKGFS